MSDYEFAREVEEAIKRLGPLSADQAARVAGLLTLGKPS